MSLSDQLVKIETQSLQLKGDSAVQQFALEMVENIAILIWNLFCAEFPSSPQVCRGALQVLPHTLCMMTAGVEASRPLSAGGSRLRRF